MRSSVDDAPENSPGALFKEASALREAGRWEDAARRYQAVLARVDDDPEAAALGLHAGYLRTVCLHAQRDDRETLAACDALLSRYGNASDELVANVVADTLWLKSGALARLGDAQQERAVLRSLIEGYSDRPRPQVARALYNEGVHLRDEGRAEEAIQMWDELFARFAPEPPESDPFIPIRAQLAKSQILAANGHLDAALVTCDRMLEECARLRLPEAAVAEVTRAAHSCMAAARKSRGLGGRLRAIVKRH